MTSLVTTSILVTALSLTACGVPGRFQTSVRADRPLFYFINKLDANPRNIQAQTELSIFYAQAVARHERAIQIHSRAERFFRVLYEMEALQHIYNSLQKVPIAFIITNPKDYSKLMADIEKIASYYDWMTGVYEDLAEPVESDDQ
jgi:hypothetical protein